MRADRLLSTLMLLQMHGKMTAHDLAEELEVSERTVYRDMEALSAVGVPVYAERGPGGGCALVDSYRTNLTGLNAGELQALFMLSIPTPLNDLGVSQELKTALLKLSAALPESGRNQENLVRQRIYLDWSGWQTTPQPITLLPILQQALWNDRKLQLRYLLPFSNQTERVVEPLGLVAKADQWYLVYRYQSWLRVHPVQNLLEAHLVDEPFTRPPDFDLKRYWHAYCRKWEENRPCYPVQVRIAASLIPSLPHLFGKEMVPSEKQPEATDATGSIDLTLHFESLEAARERLMALGQAVEVIHPRPLRLSICDYARQILHRYESEAWPDRVECT